LRCITILFSKLINISLNNMNAQVSRVLMTRECTVGGRLWWYILPTVGVWPSLVFEKTLQCDNIGNLWESLVSNSLATLSMEESLNSDSPQFQQYQQNDQWPLTPTHWHFSDWMQSTIHPI